MFRNFFDRVSHDFGFHAYLDSICWNELSVQDIIVYKVIFVV